MRLKELRDSVGITQSEVANMLHIKQNTYSQYETGQRQIPITLLVTLARHYNVSVDYILELTDNDIPYDRR